MLRVVIETHEKLIMNETTYNKHYVIKICTRNVVVLWYKLYTKKQFPKEKLAKQRKWGNYFQLLTELVILTIYEVRFHCYPCISSTQDYKYIPNGIKNLF